jgi:hypothetical protein
MPINGRRRADDRHCRICSRRFHGLVPNVYFRAHLARIFLLAEFATSMLYAAEEFPAQQRGMVIGVVSACQSLGALTCGVVPALLAPVDGEWFISLV